MFIVRFAQSTLLQALSSQASVALIGPRQSGKTTLAQKIARETNALYVDLQRSSDRQMLDDPDQFFERNSDRLVILDEIHTMPDIFREMRGAIDRARALEHRTGMFLLLGSASLELLRRGSESLAGRISYVDLLPISVIEAQHASIETATLWLRGGFPDSLTSEFDSISLDWRNDFIRSYIERDIRLFSERMSSALLKQLLHMIAYAQGSLLNITALARALGVSTTTVRNYIEFLENLLIVRKLTPYHVNLKKQLVKSPKLYIRDSGLVHALLGLPTELDLLQHPVVGFSWEGFVIENLISSAPPGTQASFYRTAKGAEIDLLLRFRDGSMSWAVEVKRNVAAPTRKGFHFARQDVNPTRSLIVHSGKRRFPQPHGVEAIGLPDLCNELRSMWS